MVDCSYSLFQCKITFYNFPDGPVVKNLPANAGDASLIPGLGRLRVLRGNWAHAPQLLRPECLQPMLCNKKRHCSEKPALQLESSYPPPPSQQLEKACIQKRRPSTAKNQWINWKKKTLKKIESSHPSGSSQCTSPKHGRGVQDEEHMYTHGGIKSMYGKTNTML